jgi:hypothetical protein
MTNVLEQHAELQEQIECNANCKHCGASILVESSIVGAGVKFPYRKVIGSFVQFIDDTGEPFGPWWAFCNSCVTSGIAVNPVDLSDVQAAYLKLKP